MSNKEVYIDPINTTFARVMEICTWIGLIVMLVFGVLYLFELNSYVSMSSVVSHWGLPASKFWEETKGVHINGYLFLHHLNTMDCLSLIGISLLALAPFFSLIGTLFRAKGIYFILILILLCEYIFAIIRPLIMAGGGE